MTVESQILDYRPLLRRGERCLPVCERWRQKLISMGCADEKILIHKMGVDCEQFRIDTERPTSDTINIASVGRLVEKKGFEYAMRALASLLPAIPNLHYRIVGDGPLQTRLEQLAADLGLTHHISFLGARTAADVINILQTTEIFIAPSVTAANGDQEGIPVSIMEALAMQLPVISTNHSAIGELIVDGVTGLLVEERSVSMLAERIQYLIENVEARRELGKNGRAYVERHHNVHTLNDELIEILHTAGQPLNTVNSGHYNRGQIPDNQCSSA